LTSGLAPILTNQYNANVGAQQGAAGTLYGAGSGTATTGAQLGQIPLQNQLQALQAQGTLPGLLTQPAMTQLAAANTAQGLPGQNIAGQENLVLPIAGLGGQTSGTGTSTTTSQTPLINTLLSAGALAAGTAGALSDERAKENIERVGLLHNGLPVYKYNYRHDPLKTTQVGLLAQEVERMLPEAVIEDDSGLKYVNYNLATAPPANAMAA
jgi:hypothetical protein